VHLLNLRGSSDDEGGAGPADSLVFEVPNDAADVQNVARGREQRSAFPPNELAALGGREKAGRRQWKMTAAQRKAVGERMRKYWAHTYD
jgi:hypothetical protein